METQVQQVARLTTFVTNYKNEILMPLAQAGVLTKELCYEAVKMYMDEIEQRKVRDVVLEVTKDNKYSCFHPFHSAPFTIDGKEWLSVEHYYRAAHFFGVDDDFVEEIRTAKNPAVAHRRGVNGTSSGRRVRPDWDKESANELKKAYMCMLDAHPELKKTLIETDIARLVLLPPPVDTYIGVDKQGEGQNMAGKVLVEIRNEL